MEYYTKTKRITNKDLYICTAHTELCSMLRASLHGRGIWERMNTRIFMAESLCCSPEAITTLLLSYIPISNKKLKNNKLLKRNEFDGQLC